MVKSLSSANVGDNFGSFHELTTTAHFEGRGVAFAPWDMSVPIKLSVNIGFLSVKIGKKGERSEYKSDLVVSLRSLSAFAIS